MRMGGEERCVGETLLEQKTMDRERHRDIRARSHRKVQVSRLRDGRGPRIDDDDAGAVLPGLAKVRDRVNAGHRRIHAPEHDEPRVRVVLVGDGWHLAVERQIGRPCRGRAHGACQARGAEPPEEQRVQPVVREHAVRAAVAERQDRFGAPFRADSRDPRRDQLEGLVPLDARKRGVLLRARADHRVAQTRIAVHAVGEPAHLGADVAVRDSVVVPALDVDDSPVPDRHRQTARVGAVEWARGQDGRARVSADRFDFGHLRSVHYRSERTRLPPGM